MRATPQPSPQLLAFAEEHPWERRTILAFMCAIAAELEPGARLLDVGAGEQPYRELFAHLDYVTTDWANSVHPGARKVDIVAPADDLPIEEGSFDAVVCTQVLEHVAEPLAVLSELFRVLRPGGRLYLTVPLTWEEHEAPYDFFRYTRFGLEHLLAGAGFRDVAVEARNDSFSTIAQLLRNAGAIMGRADDGNDPQRGVAAHTMRHLSDLVASFAPLDAAAILPLGYQARAVRHAPVERAECRRAVGLENAREAVYVAFADEPEMLAAFAQAVQPGDQVTLALYAREGEPAALEAGVTAAASAAGLLDDERFDLVAISLGAPVDEAALARAVDGVLSGRPVTGPLARVSRFDARMLGGLRGHAALPV